MGSENLNKAVVADFFDRVWCRKDLDFHHEILAPEFQLTALWQNTSLGGAGQADRDVSLAVISRWIGGFPDLRISIEEQVADGDHVASRHRFWGTHANDFMGYQATHIPVTISGNTMMRVVDGKIVAAWSCWDAASFLTQIGKLPGAPQAPSLREADLRAWCADDPVTQADPEAAKALVRRVYQRLWSDGDLAAAPELLAADFTGHTPGSHAIRGPQGLTEVIAGWRRVLSGLEVHVDAQFAEAGAVATRFTVSGKHAGVFAGRAPTGAAVRFTGIAITHVAGGRVVSDWTEFDLAGVFQTLDSGTREGQP